MFHSNVPRTSGLSYPAPWILAWATVVYGLNVPFQKLALPPATVDIPRRLASRGDPYGFEDMLDNVYTAELWVAGQNYTVSPRGLGSIARLLIGLASMRLIRFSLTRAVRIFGSIRR